MSKMIDHFTIPMLLHGYSNARNGLAYLSQVLAPQNYCIVCIRIIKLNTFVLLADSILNLHNWGTQIAHRPLFGENRSQFSPCVIKKILENLRFVKIARK